MTAYIPRTAPLEMVNQLIAYEMRLPRVWTGLGDVTHPHFIGFIPDVCNYATATS